MEKINFQEYRSPVGELYIYADHKNLLAVTFEQNQEQVLKQLSIENPEEKSTPVIRQTISQFKKYFRGELKTFRIPMKLRGTPFQLASWNALRKIPFGKFSSYKKQAQILKKAKVVRAIGAANSRNPISIIVPCHRIIGEGGMLVGYAAGLITKTALLEIEGVIDS